MGVVLNLNKSLAFAKKQVNGCTFLSTYKTGNGDEKFKAVMLVNGKKKEIFIPSSGSLEGGFEWITDADIIKLIQVLNEYKSNKENL